MDRLLSSDAYLNLRFRLGLEILFGHLIGNFLLVLIRNKKARLVEFINFEKATDFCVISTVDLTATK